MSISGFGCILIDYVISRSIEQELYNDFKTNYEFHISNEHSLAMFHNKIKDFDINKFQLGGSALNTIRTINYILSNFNKAAENERSLDKDNNGDYDKVNSVNNVSLVEPNSFIGSIGKDVYSKKIDDQFTKEKILFKKEVFTNIPTSVNIVLIDGNQRDFITDLTVTKKITLEFIKQTVDSDFKNKFGFYADAYLIGALPDIYDYTFKTYFSNNEFYLSLCLGSSVTVKENFVKILDILPYVDYVFLNEDELDELSKNHSKSDLSINNLNNNSNDDYSNYNNFIKDFFAKLEKKNTKKDRVVVITRGDKSTLIYHKKYDVENDDSNKDVNTTNNNNININNTNNFNSSILYDIPIISLRENEIIDTNGAGDCYSGGFLAGIILGFDIEQSAIIGNIMASGVLKKKGFQIPNILSIKEVYNKLNL